MHSFRINDRIYHQPSGTNVTGTVVNFGYGDLIGVEWDNPYDSNPSYWLPSELRLIPYTSPPPKLEKETQDMSQALWCDKGGHAFSAKDTDREHYTSTRSVKDGMTVTQVTAELDICGPCTKDVVLFEAPQLTTGSTVQDKVPGQ